MISLKKKSYLFLKRFAFVKRTLKKCLHFFRVISFNHHDKSLTKVFKKFLDYSGLPCNNLISNGINIKRLNTNSYDAKIEGIMRDYYDKNTNMFLSMETNPSKKTNMQQPPNVGIIFTELYNTGGHTPLVKRFIESFSKEYTVVAFTSRILSNSYKKGNFDVMDEVETCGVHWNLDVDRFSELAKDLYNEIVKNNIDILFCYIHPQDIVSSALFALLKYTTKIKIVHINVQDHFYSLGFKFADLIIDARPSGQYITKKVRGFNNSIILPLHQKRKEKITYLSPQEIQDFRKNLGVNDDEYITLTGCASYKIFMGDESPYLEMIRDILIENPKLKHILMTEFKTPNEEKVFNRVFHNHPKLLKRIIITPKVKEFDPYIQACDLFIDSFPQGGALIHVDVMRNKKLSIIKIDKEYPIRSFEYYLPKNYKYMYDSIQDMRKGVKEILNLGKNYKNMCQINYNHYLNTYEFDVVKNEYKKIIDQYNNLKVFYEN